jgi:glycosyltransferase involved in cell wall biosynthesis
VTETLLRDANVVLVPNSLDPFSRCKSANRALLALAHGVPVVATRTRALEPLSPCVIFDDWVGGIERYLEDKELAQAHLRVANDIIQREFSGLALAEEWKRLFACFGTRASRASSSSKNRLSRPVNCKHGQDEVCALGLREAEEVEGRTP